MSYSTPATQTTGDVIGASQWNTLVNDIVWLAESSASGRPMCFAYRTATLSVADNTSTALTWDSEEVDNASCHSTAVNPSRFTAPVNGWYRVSTWLSWAANATGVRGCNTKPSTIGTTHASDIRSSFGIFDCGQCVTDVIHMQSGQYVEIIGYQNSGGALNLQTRSFVWFEWVGTY